MHPTGGLSLKFIHSSSRHQTPHSLAFPGPSIVRNRYQRLDVVSSQVSYMQELGCCYPEDPIPWDNGFILLLSMQILWKAMPSGAGLG